MGNNNQYPPQPSLIREGAEKNNPLSPCGRGKSASRFTLHPSLKKTYRLKKAAFTLAEMMVVMLILSIVMAAMAPVMTTRNKLDQSSPWQWASNGSDAYYALGDAQVAMIGQEEADNTDTSSRLVINAPDGKDHILFKTGDNVLGRIKFKNSGLLIGGLSSGDLVTNSVAVGRNTSVGGSNSTAIGTNSTATGSSATAIGFQSNATGTQSTAIGNLAESSDYYAIAIGYTAKASREATSIGFQAEASGTQSTAIGLRALASEKFSNAIGYSSNASGPYSIAAGFSSEASGDTSTAIGYSAKATNLYTTAIGPNAEATAQYTNAIGYNSKTMSDYTNAIGYQAIASGTDASAIGSNANASGVQSNAIGADAVASGFYSNAIGYDATATANYSNAIGRYADASGVGSIALGYNTEASGTSAIAIGEYANAAKNYNVAIGRSSCTYATGDRVTCIGAYSGPESGSSLASKSYMVYLGDSLDTVYIPGNLVVGGHVILGLNKSSYVYLRTAHKGNTDKQASKSKVALARSEDWHGDDDNFGISYPPDSVTFFKNYKDEMKIVSDRRLKYVGKESTSGLDKIRQLKVFNYTFKKDEKKTPHVGVIAQDLQKVFPDAVKKGVDGFLTIRFEDMFYAMINAIKELDTRVTTLQKENQQLTELLKQVQDDNKELNAVLKQVQNDNKKLDARLKAIEAKIK